MYVEFPCEKNKNGGMLMLFSNVALASDAFEIISFKFNDTVKLEEQKELMVKLNKIVKSCEGFRSRDYYYSSENCRWIDFVVWTDIKLAEKSSKALMEDPRASEIFVKIEEKSMIFSHYSRIGGEKKD